MASLKRAIYICRAYLAKASRRRVLAAAPVVSGIAFPLNAVLISLLGCILFMTGLQAEESQVILPAKFNLNGPLSRQ